MASIAGRGSARRVPDARSAMITRLVSAAADPATACAGTEKAATYPRRTMVEAFAVVASMSCG